MKEFVKKCLKGCALGRLVYEPVHWCYRLYSVPHRKRMLQKHGPEVARHLVEVFKRHEIPGFAAYGTLLGFVRNGGFMRHDDDIDVGILPGKYSASELLGLLLHRETGFKFLFAFKYQERLTEFKLEYKGVPIDFFIYERGKKGLGAHAVYFFPDAVYPDTSANSSRIVWERDFTALTMVKVGDFEFPVPEHAEESLAALYGEDWKKPNPNWSDDNHPGREDLPEFSYLISEEEALRLR